jgi:hypothetical protein
MTPRPPEYWKAYAATHERELRKYKQEYYQQHRRAIIKAATDKYHVGKRTVGDVGTVMKAAGLHEVVRKVDGKWITIGELYFNPAKHYLRRWSCDAGEYQHKSEAVQAMVERVK